MNLFNEMSKYWFRGLVSKKFSATIDSNQVAAHGAVLREIEWKTAENPFRHSLWLTVWVIQLWNHRIDHSQNDSDSCFEELWSQKKRVRVELLHNLPRKICHKLRNSPRNQPLTTELTATTSVVRNFWQKWTHLESLCTWQCQVTNRSNDRMFA